MFAEVLLACAASPPSDDALAAHALQWLEPRVTSTAWTKTDAGHANDASKRIVVDALVAWLELARNDRQADEKLLAQLDARIRSHLGDKSGVFGGFANWTDGFAGLYSIERELRGRGGAEILAEVARGFAGRQNAEGGWDHGASFGLSFYPSTLVATTNLALVSLGFARRFGLETDAESIVNGLALLSDVQGTSGGMPYGGRPYTKGIEAGRTCGTVLALSSLGLGDDPRCARAGAYVLRNVDAIPDGHASTAFHLFLGALACSALGPAVASSFDEQVLARVRKAQRPDGTFASIVAESPDEMSFMSDTETNRAYVTALSAAALLARGSRTASALTIATPPLTESESTIASAALQPTWHVPLAQAELVDVVGERVFVLDAKGHARWLSIADGKQTAAFDLPFAAEAGEFGSFADDQGVLVWKAPTGDGGPVFMGGMAVGGGVQDESGKTVLACVPALRNEPAWSRALKGRVLVAGFAADHVIARTLGGHIDVLARKSGSVLPDLPTSGVLPNAALGSAGGSLFVCGAESCLTCVDLGARSSGSATWPTTWERRNRARGLIPPAWTVVASTTMLLVAGRTDGSVVALDPKDGSTRWETATGSSVRRIVVDAKSGRVFALTHDGRVCAIDAGAVVWTRDVDRGHESHDEPGLKLSGDHVWVASPSRGALVCLAARDGSVEGEQIRQSGRPWSVRADVLFVANEEGIDALQLR